MPSHTLPHTAPEAIPVASTAVPATPPEPPPEETLFVVHPNMVRRYPLRCAMYAVLTLAAVALSVWAFSADYTLIGAALLGLGAFLVGRFAFWYARMNATALVVTNRRVILETGAVTRQASEFALDAVTDIEARQGFLCRMLNVGDLIITTGTNSDKRQMVMMAVEQPLAVADRIRTAKG
jgi:uncharacterized membrane protein YdbT with pleckstrin-like domain